MNSKPTSFRRHRHRRVKLRDCNMDNVDFRRLYRIFRLTICPDMSEKAFEAYYGSPDLDFIDVSFFYTGSGEMTGFSAAAFYKRIVGGRPFIIARSATGMLPQYRGGSLSKMTLYSKYMQYKLKHPGQRMILTIFASNPFVYNMVCKYTGMVYPRYNQPIPDQIMDLKNDILESSKLQRRERQPFVVRINFEVVKTEDFRQQAFLSANPNVRFFVHQTGLRHCMSLLLIIPVSFPNIFCCLWLMLWYGMKSRTISFFKAVRNKSKIYQNRLTCWLNHFRQAGYANEKSM